MYKIMFLLLLISLSAETTLFAQGEDHFTGVFSNPEITLKLKGLNGQYQGQVQLEGRSFVVSARILNRNTIAGIYVYDGENIAFQGTINGNTLTIYTEGVSYILKRENIKTVSPETQQGTTDARVSDKTISSSKGTIRNDDWGISLVPPPGWQAKFTGEGYLMASPEEKGLFLILPHEAGSLEEIRQEAQKGLSDEYGTRLSLSGQLQPFGKNGLAGEFIGKLQGQNAKAYAIGLLSPFGVGATILRVMKPDDFGTAQIELVRNFAQKIEFYKPPVSPIAQQWKENLSGCKLSYFSRYSSGSSGGYTSETAIDLCPQGFFRYGVEDETVWNAVPGTLTGGYSMQYGKGSGKWQVVSRGQQAVLILNFYNGKVYEYILSTNEKNQTFLNNKRYLRTCNPNDQVVEARPNCW